MMAVVFYALLILIAIAVVLRLLGFRPQLSDKDGSIVLRRRKKGGK